MAAKWAEAQLALSNPLIRDGGAAPTPVKQMEATFKLLALTLNAVEPIIVSTPQNHISDGCRYMYTALGVADQAYWPLRLIMYNTHPPLPDGVTHWDDLALLLSPYRVRCATGRRASSAGGSGEGKPL